MRAIFISYRRSDAEAQARLLLKDLRERFGKEAVFMDVVGMKKGLDFRLVLDENLASCGVLLAIIGKGWLSAADEDGKRRLENPEDYIRLETSTALGRGIPVIPVLVGGARMPRLEELPEDVKNLVYREGVELTHARWDSDVQELISALVPYVEGKLETSSPKVSKKLVGLLALAAAVAVGAGYLAYDLVEEARKTQEAQAAADAARQAEEARKTREAQAAADAARQAEEARKTREAQAAADAARQAQEARKTRADKAAALPAPKPTTPQCGGTVPMPDDNHFFIVGWEAVQGASTYDVELDCFGCSGRVWYSLAGSPWRVAKGVGLRTPIYSSKVHVELRQAGGLALRWRVWAVDHRGQQGKESDWCQISFAGTRSVRPN